MSGNREPQGRMRQGERRREGIGQERPDERRGAVCRRWG